MSSVYCHRIIVRCSQESFPIIATLAIMYKLDNIIISYAKGCYDITFCSTGINHCFPVTILIVSNIFFSHSYSLLENIEITSKNKD